MEARVNSTSKRLGLGERTEGESPHKSAKSPIFPETRGLRYFEEMMSAENLDHLFTDGRL